MAKIKPRIPIYELPHGIKVLKEFPISGSNRYVRALIVEHKLFDAKSRRGVMLVRKSRAVMTSIIGRKLLSNEHVHHKNEDRSDDSPENLELIGSKEHNRHHKLGSSHSDEAKRKIGAGLKRAIQEGRRLPPPAGNWKGRKHTEQTKFNMSESRKRLIAEGKLKPPKPPCHKGEKAPTSKLTNRDIVEIRRRVLAGENKKAIAEDYGVVFQSIYNIANRVTWKHI